MIQRMREVKLVLIGETGVGKSTLINKALNINACKVGAGLSSETLLPNKAVGHLFGDRAEEKVELIDSAGPNDSRGNDFRHLEALVAKLKEEQQISAFILVLNGQDTRFKRSTLDMLDLFTNMYPNFWEKVIVLVNFWALDDKARKKREATGRVEGLLVDEILNQIRIRYGRLYHLRLYFIDAEYDRDCREEEEAFRKTFKSLVIVAKELQTDTQAFQALKPVLESLEEEKVTLQSKLKTTEEGLKKMEVEHQNKIATLAQNAKDFEQKYQRDMARLRDESAKELANLGSRSQAQIAQIQEQQRQKEQQLQNELTAQKQAHEKAVEEERLRQSNLMEQLKNQISQLQTEIATAKEDQIQKEGGYLQLYGKLYSYTFQGNDWRGYGYGKGRRNLKENDDFQLIASRPHKVHTIEVFTWYSFCQGLAISYQILGDRSSNSYRQIVRGKPVIGSCYDSPTKESWTLSDDEYIVGFGYRSGDIIDQVRFTTSKGRNLIAGGNGGGERSGINAQQGNQLSCFAWKVSHHLNLITLREFPIPKS